MENKNSVRFLIAGKLQREFIITADRRTHLDKPGGNLLYSAGGLSIWNKEIGLISRVGEDYPQTWLANLSQNGFDRRGIKILPESIDLRMFRSYSSENKDPKENPVSSFAKLGYKFPKPLLGFTPAAPKLDSRTQLSPISLRINDVPADYMDATAAHICPLDYLSHSLLPSVLRQGHVTTITLSPSSGYMDPVFWDDIPKILNNITVFITSEEDIRSLFEGKSTDLWEMAEALASYGCEILLINQKAKGHFLYNHANHERWIIPPYAVEVTDPTGGEDAFCGGFLAGYRETYDPKEAALYGTISKSLTIEGSGPFYAMDALPGLAKARMESLRNMLRKF